MPAISLSMVIGLLMAFASVASLLFSGSMLFIALIIFLLLGPVLTGESFPITDVMVVLIMGMICFIPFFLYLRGALMKGKL